MSYRPVKDGIEKSHQLVTYEEVEPPQDLQSLVHCFWQLKTIAPLPQNFVYHVIPDACANLLFDQKNLDVAAVTAIHTKAIQLELGTDFHYIGVQLLPGAWRGPREEVQDGLVTAAYDGSLPLNELNRSLSNLEFSAQQEVLTKFLKGLIAKSLIKEHALVSRILQNLQRVNSVAEMAELVELSQRQLQRSLKFATGFSPHDFLKVLRLQQSLREDYLAYYTDQSHFIRSFKTVVGYTPGKFREKFDDV